MFFYFEKARDPQSLERWFRRQGPAPYLGLLILEYLLSFPFLSFWVSGGGLVSTQKEDLAHPAWSLVPHSPPTRNRAWNYHVHTLGPVLGVSTLKEAS